MLLISVTTFIVVLLLVFIAGFFTHVLVRRWVRANRRPSYRPEPTNSPPMPPAATPRPEPEPYKGHVPPRPMPAPAPSWDKGMSVCTFCGGRKVIGEPPKRCVWCDGVGMRPDINLNDKPEESKPAKPRRNYLGELEDGST